MDETDKIYLVVTYIEKYTGRAWYSYEGKRDIATCPMKVSFRASHEDLGVPLWFPTEEAAENYWKKVAANGTERDFYLIQEFTYPRRDHRDEAKIIFSCKSDTWPVLAEGKTERAPGIWAHVRSFFICDKAAAEDYVDRFNEDAAAAYNVGRKE